MEQFGGGQSYSWCPVDGSLWDEERKDEYIDMIVQVYFYRFWLCFSIVWLIQRERYLQQLWVGIEVGGYWRLTITIVIVYSL